jgi:hypothetical protein
MGCKPDLGSSGRADGRRTPAKARTPPVDVAFLHGELGAEVVAEICAVMKTSDPGLAAAAGLSVTEW